ncbi:Nramp family divalent metal transporter (plasmid) [Haloferacaceae archaeon DSL9]
MGADRRSIKRRLRAIGPALLLAAVVVGPGSITLSTIAGSLYGYQLLWVPVVATFFMIVYTWMAARIGLVTGDTLFEVTRAKFGPAVAGVGGLFGFLTIVSFQAGNSAGIGFASNALFGFDVRLWAILFTGLAIGFVWLPDLYEKIELLVKVVVGILIVTFVGTLFLVGFDVRAAGVGLVPSFPDVDSVFTSLGITATTFSIAAAVYQTHLMREKAWDVDELGEELLDTILGIAVLGLIVVVIVLTSASVVHDEGDPVFSAASMALQLEPLAGPAAFYLFSVGFFFASLSSLVVNAIIGATLLVDGFGKNASMESHPVKLWSTIAMVIGLLPVVAFQESPVELLRAAQAFAVIAFPILAFLVLSISSDRTYMGAHPNSKPLVAIGIVGYLIVVGIVFNYFREVLVFL